MKKALALAVVLVLGLGAWAFAAAEFSGAWKTTIGIDVSAVSFASFFTGLDSSLTLDYTGDNWVFGSISTFGSTGYTAQHLTAAGTIGAFTVSSTVAFAPMQVSEWTYPDVAVALPEMANPQAGFESQTGPALDALCAVWKPTATKYDPAFLSWQTAGSVSIAGLTIEGLFYLDRSNIEVATINALFEDVPSHSFVQTSARYVDCATKDNGSGWRLRLSGTFAGMTITSSTYFNLYEYTNAAYNSILGLPACPTIGMSGVFKIAAADCTAAFSREVITLGGFALGCATMDVALDILCNGFDSFAVLIQNVMLGSFLDLDFSITFTATDKTFAICLSFTGLTSDCVTIELGFAGGGLSTTETTLDGFAIHGIGLVYSFDWLKITTFTELTEYSTLFSSSTDWTYTYGGEEVGFLVPFAGALTCPSGDCCGETEAACVNLSDELYELRCAAVERFRLWEKLSIHYESDACCGGGFWLMIDTYFGEHEILDYFAYAGYEVDSTTPDLGPVFLYGEDPGLPSDYWDLDEPVQDCDYVATDYDYSTGTLPTLFAWAKSAVNLSFGLYSNFSLQFGAAANPWGWESLLLGFTATF